MYGVQNLMKKQCSMLLGDMNISAVMTHAQHVEGDKLIKQVKKNKKVGLETVNTLKRNHVVEIARRVNRSFQHQPLHQLVFHPPIFVLIRKVGS